MNDIEDRLRAAAKAAAHTVAPGSAPPLDLDALDARSRTRSPWGRRRSATPRPGRYLASPRILAPAAAAAAVVAVIAASLVLTGGTPGASSQHNPGGPASSGPTPSVPTPGTTPSALTPADRAALASVPSYYVALNGMQGEHNEAVVRATATGAVLGTVTAPQPYGTFDWVSAAADDRTFALAAQPWHAAKGGIADSDNEPTAFFLLHLDGSGHPSGLTEMRIPAEPSSAWVDGIALSPDASQLAIAVDQFSHVNPKLQVFTVATGSAKTWTWQGSGCICNTKPIGSVLSWTSDGRTVAFQIVPSNGTIEVRLLGTDSQGGSLKASALALEWTRGDLIGPKGVVIPGTRQAPGNSLDGYNTLISPDGTKIVCVTTTSGAPSGEVTEFSVSTGAIASSLGATANTADQAQDVAWSSPTGSTVVGLTSTGAAVITGISLTPIPGADDQLITFAW